MVVIPTFHAGWLRFSRLDSLEGIDQVYTMAWRFTDDRDATDLWTNRLLNFKRGNEVRSAISAMKTALYDLALAESWNPKETALVPVLSSGHKYTDPQKPIPMLTKACAESAGSIYLPNMLSKQPHRALHQLETATARRNEVRNAGYIADLSCCPGNKRIIIVDDLVTNGDTMSAIACAIRSQRQEVEIYGIALGKNESRTYADSHRQVINNNHVPTRWDYAWQNGS
jgi:hypothetical protein